ncbi:DUF2750 domain-containing protein [Bacillus pumilus]|nr:DUF2750 domain-containing protein [Bacillus pumilus]
MGKIYAEMIDLDDFIEEWLPGMIADGINQSFHFL